MPVSSPGSSAVKNGASIAPSSSCRVSADRIAGQEVLRNRHHEAVGAGRELIAMRHLDRHPYQGRGGQPLAFAVDARDRLAAAQIQRLGQIRVAVDVDKPVMNAGARANSLGMDEARLSVGVDVAIELEGRDLSVDKHGRLVKENPMVPGLFRLSQRSS